MPITPLLHAQDRTEVSGEHTSRRTIVNGVTTMVLLAVLFCALTALVARSSAPPAVDADASRWIIDHRNGGLTVVAKTLAVLGGTASMTVLTAIACVWSAWRRQWDAAVLVAMTGLGALVLVLVGKHLVARDRPPMAGRLSDETSYAYPSGHTAGSFVVIGIVMIVALPYLRGIVRRVLPIAAAVLVAAVGLSRIYLGAHWPTDILAGWLLGALWLMVCLTTFEYVSAVVARRGS
ncbi:phosphatase PAP2 family protein [Nocardia uniformis]|uniref:Phosphatase PAP2 family protein n=1 Tax=Nocardia uniformis TaxID=53432 RepID=A0A849CFQ5_9NOCA|nr:phosphatase PAP2 family protein [Nocardia uniformis]NNH72251.1 phosphatase PAP2 family protein [Nocardia uniformis]